MMTDLDCWVIQKTVEWIAEARPNSIRSYSVNVSSQSLDDARLPDFISGVLQRCGVKPAQLCLEIDEVDTLKRAQAAEQFARVMHTIGCKVIIDGFARRSVSFSALKSLQPEYVKVDGAVVRKISSSPVAQLKLKAIARVCAVAGIGDHCGMCRSAGNHYAVDADVGGLCAGIRHSGSAAISTGGFPPA